jgi:hypothetical protein
MKASVEKHLSSSTKPITCTIASSANLMYLRIFSTNILDEENVFHNLIRGFTSKGFSSPT